MVLVLILKYYILCQLNSSQSIIYPDKIRTQLFKVKDFVNEHIVKNWTFLLPFFLNIKYDIYTNIFFAGEKKNVGSLQKLLKFFFRPKYL